MLYNVLLQGISFKNNNKFHTLYSFFIFTAITLGSFINTESVG